VQEKTKIYDPEIIERAEIQSKYGIYIEKEKDLVQKTAQLEDLLIPDTFDYDRIIFRQLLSDMELKLFLCRRLL
jgi:tRNA uridine 5-carboxymethylaminomethyl modification enzyme